MPYRDRMGVVHVTKLELTVNGLPVMQTKELGGFRSAEKSTETVAPLDSSTAFVLPGLPSQQTIDMEIVWQPGMPSHKEIERVFIAGTSAAFVATLPQTVLVDTPETSGGVEVKVAFGFGEGTTATAVFTPAGQDGFDLQDARVQVGHNFVVGSQYYSITTISDAGVYQVTKAAGSASSISASAFQIVQRAQRFAWDATVTKYEHAIEEDAYIIGRITLGVTSEIVHTEV